MKITNVKLRFAKHYLFVQIYTDAGITGLGEAGNWGYLQATAAAIEKFADYLIGKDPFRIEDFNQNFLRSVYFRGSVIMSAISAIDIALWDIKGKVLNMPLFRLLGGNDPVVPIYASGGWTSYSIEELVDEAKMMVARGYKKIKLKVGVDGGRNPMEDVRRVAAVREAIGPDIGFMLDANNVWRAGTAIQFANNIRDYNIEFFEEPVFADDIPGLAEFKRGTDIPLATGEHEYTRYGIRDLLLNNAADVIQCDTTRIGGYTETLRAISMSQAWNKAYAPHGMEHIHMHLVAAATNGTMLERLFMFEDLVNNVYLDAPQPVNGYLTIPDKPGLGLELNQDYLAECRRRNGV